VPDFVTGSAPVRSGVGMLRRRVRLTRTHALLGVISAGGALGSLARWAVGAAFPAEAGGFPWATFTVNVLGCLLIGGLMVFVGDVWPTRRLLRPFLGIGLLGGFTTFSTYVVDVHRLLANGAAATALTYLSGTVMAALAATYGGALGARSLVRRALWRRRSDGGGRRNDGGGQRNDGGGQDDERMTRG
jgi:CrcB protein